MCVVSMIMDARYDDWQRRYPYGVTSGGSIPGAIPMPGPPVPMPTQTEIDEFRRLLDRAREYDKRNGEPECELEEKRQRLKDLADKLGVKIEFV